MQMDGGQRLCLLLLVITGLAILGGGLAPYWLHVQVKVDAVIADASYTVNVGQLFSCSFSQASVVGTVVAQETRCQVMDFQDKDSQGLDTFQVGRVLTLVCGVLVVLLGPVTCCACCCCGNNAARALGGTAVIAGLVGVAGGAIFIAETRDGVKDIGTLMALLQALVREGGLLVTSSDFFWACYVYMAACCLEVLLGLTLVLLPGNKPSALPVAMPLPMRSPLLDHGPAYNRL